MSTKKENKLKNIINLLKIKNNNLNNLLLKSKKYNELNTQQKNIIQEYDILKHKFLKFQEKVNSSLINKNKIIENLSIEKNNYKKKFREQKKIVNKLNMDIFKYKLNIQQLEGNCKNLKQQNTEYREDIRYIKRNTN